MSGVLRPVGPERPSTYWLRRLLIALVVLLVVVAVAHACAGGSSGGPNRPRAATTPSSSPQPSIQQTVTPVVRSCAGSALAVSIATDQADYPVGSTPRFTARLRTTGTQPCHLRSGPARELWTVTSGNDQIWSTKGCTGTSKLTKVTLRPHKPHLISIVWNGDRRDTDCADTNPATAGTYQLAATIDGVVARPLVFDLTSP
jgi:hypothetical protein